MTFAPRQNRWAEDRAEYERSIGIPDRLPICDDRDAIHLDLRKHGGENWQIEPRLGYTSCRLRNIDSGEVQFVGTMKQVMRFVSRKLFHQLGARNLQ